MKKLTSLLVLLFLVSTIQSQTGWFWQNPYPQGNPLHSISFVHNYGWAVGPSGTAVHTTDGGSTWEIVDLGTTENLNSVYMHDDLMTFIVGDNGLILFVMEHPDSFEITQQTSNTTVNLNAVTSNINGCPWVAGDEGTVLRSDDMAVTWETQNVTFNYDLNSLHNIECTEAWAVGPDGFVLYTYNLGVSWSYVPTPTSWDLFSIDVGTFENIRVSGQQGLIMHTDDKGLTWEIEHEEAGYNLYDVINVGLNGAYAAGGDGIILETLDYGESWSHPITNTNTTLYDVEDHWGYDHIWAVGHYGVILKNSGVETEFVLQNEGTMLFLQSVEFVDENTGWAAGGDPGWGGTTDGIILHTTDGGETWNEQLNLTTPLNDMVFINENKGWAVGKDGLIKFTTNGGASWGTQTGPIGGLLTSVCFTDENNGWIVSRDNWGEIIHTSNGGITWTEQVNPSGNPLHDVFFINQNKGWAVGLDSSVIKTTDGGANWEWINVNASQGYRFASLFFVDEMHGWIAGIYGSILRTTDGGANWQEVESGTDETLNDIYFVDAEKGWAVGDAGTILHTIDGGVTWFVQVSEVATNFLTSICFVDASKGWVVGEGGTIIHTTHGGSNMVNTIYVDASNQSGMEDGSLEHPFNTVAEGIDAAVAGDSVFIFNGEYLETPLTELYLKDGLIIAGEDSANTIIHIPFRNADLAMEEYTEITSLTCPEMTLSMGDGSATVKVKGCHIGGVGYSSGGGYAFIVEDCTIEGSVINTSGNNYMTIRNNHFLNGGISDSGGAPDGVEAHIIEGNVINRYGAKDPYDAAIEANSTSITIKNNTINILGPGTGMDLKSGGPTNIIGNTLTLNNGIPLDQTAGINTKAGYGVITDNTITGGYIGYSSSSGATLFENNTITKAHTGFYSNGAEKVQNNLITDCRGHGLIAHGLAGPIQNNTIIENDSAGIVIHYPVDLGGGDKNGEGRNTLQNNGYYDMVVSYNPVEPDTIFARYNLWDHETLEEILAYDILIENGSQNLVIDIGNFITFPAIPELIFPSNNSTNIDLNPEISWQQTAIPDRYHLQVAYDESFANLVVDTAGLKETTFLITLEPETAYYWKVKAENPAGSSDWSEAWQFTTGVSGIGEYEQGGFDFEIYPNPAKRMFKVQSSTFKVQSCKIELIDLFGKRVAVLFEGKSNTDQLEFDVSHLQSGVYLCKIRTENHSLTKKIIIQK
ncbi:MAG: T9SS type A sorting domain-containing protein [Bacteroidales bacterium]|nr:T9SS type A sorting domain-containing protein [Bacteroidales bacterium]